MGKAAWVVVFTVMLLVSMVLAEEPTIGERIDDAVTGITDAVNKHGGAAVDAVSSTVKSVYNWFGDKAKDLGINF